MMRKYTLLIAGIMMVGLTACEEEKKFIDWSHLRYAPDEPDYYDPDCDGFNDANDCSTASKRSFLGHGVGAMNR